MKTVLHVFPEDSELLQEAHLTYWFGNVQPHDADNNLDNLSEHPIICWCGGRRYQLSREVIACYHVKEFVPERG